VEAVVEDPDIGARAPVRVGDRRDGDCGYVTDPKADAPPPVGSVPG
jgi:hypothetical protein